jgi:hypothetical protein
MPAKKSSPRSSGRKYGKGASKSVERALHREKRGIAIGLSEARKKGAKVPRKKAA